MSFDLITSESALPGRVGRSRDQFDLLGPGRNASSGYRKSDVDNFGLGGQLSFDISMARGEWWDIANSAVAIDYVLYKSDNGTTTTQLTTADNIAPALFTGSTLFKSASLQLNGTRIESVTDQYAACSAYLERTTRPKAWLDGVGDALENTADFAARQAKYASDGSLVPSGSGAALGFLSVYNGGPTLVVSPAAGKVNLFANSPTASAIGDDGPIFTAGRVQFRKAGTYLVNLNALGTVETDYSTTQARFGQFEVARTFSDGSGPVALFINNAGWVANGQVAGVTSGSCDNTAQFSLPITNADIVSGQCFLTFSFTNFGGVGPTPLTPVVNFTPLDVHAIVQFIGEAAGAADTASERVCGQRLMHRPPLSLFYPDADAPMLPAGEYRLDLEPETNWMQAAIESISSGLSPATKDTAGNYIVRITNVSMVIHRVYGPAIDDTTYLIPLYPIVCSQRATAPSLGQQRIYVDVPASTQELGAAFRNASAGEDTRFPPTTFTLPDDGDAKVTRLYIEYDGVTKPSQSETAEYKRTAIIPTFQGFDNTTSRYFQGLAALGGDVDAIGAESLSDQHERGLLVSYDWPRDASSRATRCYVNFQYGDDVLGAPPAGTILLFARYWAAAQVQIMNSQVVGVNVRDN